MNDYLIKKQKYIKTTFELENMKFNNIEIKNIITKKRNKEQYMSKKQKYEKWEDYFIENTDTLKNIPNIENKKLLEEYEKQVSAERLSQLYDEPPIGDFNIEHLYSIHYYLFKDVYDWAGETRKVSMMKQTVFLEPEKIEPYLENVFEESKKEIKNIKDEYHLASYISTLFYNLTFAHPFREGNGRTIREFLRQLINSVDFDFGSYEIDYSKINQQTIGMGMACNAPMFIIPEFQKALIKRNINNKILKKTRQ